MSELPPVPERSWLKKAPWSLLLFPWEGKSPGQRAGIQSEGNRAPARSRVPLRRVASSPPRSGAALFLGIHFGVGLRQHFVQGPCSINFLDTDAQAELKLRQGRTEIPFFHLLIDASLNGFRASYVGIHQGGEKFIATHPDHIVGAADAPLQQAAEVQASVRDCIRSART